MNNKICLIIIVSFILLNIYKQFFKNYLYNYRDKTSRLWNCAEAKCIDIIHTADSEVNCCAITDVSQNMDLAPSLEEQSKY